METAAVGRAPRALAWTAYGLAPAALFVGWRGAFPLDDAYITLHNARALLTGWDATYAVSPFTGATSVIHLLLIAGLGLAVPLPWASACVAYLGAVAYLFGLDALARRQGAAGWRAPALVLVGCGATMPCVLANGLETGLAAACVAWLLALRRGVPVLAGLAPFVRPELAVLGALTLLARIRQYDRRERIRAIAIAAAVALPFALLSLRTTGHLVPGTLAAKIAFFRQDTMPWSERVAVEFRIFALTEFALPLLGLAFLRDRRAILFALVVVATQFALLPASFGWNDGRYLAPLIPLAIMGLARLSHTLVPSALLAVVAALTALLLPSNLARLNRERAWFGRQADALRAALGALPPGSRVLVHDAGMAAWTSPRLHLIDVVGLKTPASTVIHRRLTREACAWGPALDLIARQSGAGYAVVLQQPFWDCVGLNLAAEGWQLIPLPSYGSEYRLYKLRAKGLSYPHGRQQ